jgi:hypothetical protein
MPIPDFTAFNPGYEARMIPKSGHPGQDQAPRKGSGASKGASNQCPRPRKQLDAVCASSASAARATGKEAQSAHLSASGRARLPALHCGTRQAGRNQHWLNSRTGFPATSQGKVFCPPRRSAAVKRAPRGPILLPVDRGPRAARGRGYESRARAPLPLHQSAVTVTGDVPK